MAHYLSTHIVTMKESPYKLAEARSLADLMQLLRKICMDHYGDSNIVDRYEKMSAATRRKDYVTFYIQKKSNGVRCIQAPGRRTKEMQYVMKRALESIYEPLGCVYGFVEGRGVADNARRHLDCRFVLNMDLKDFFPTISKGMVVRALCCKPFGLTREVARKIASICCRWDEERQADVLPQGAPTSPILSNMVCYHMDVRLMGMAQHFGATYTRYADDMTFSSNHYLMGRKNPLGKQVQMIIEEEGFAVNFKKVRLQSNDSHQEVTGLTVSRKANVSKEYVKLLRRVLRTWELEGYAVARMHFMQYYQQNHICTPQQQKSIEPPFVNIIAGKLEYMKMVKGADDSTYVKLFSRFHDLVVRDLL